MFFHSVGPQWKQPGRAMFEKPNATPYLVRYACIKAKAMRSSYRDMKIKELRKREIPMKMTLLTGQYRMSGRIPYPAT